MTSSERKKRNQQLYDRIIEGDDSARDILATENMGLVTFLLHRNHLIKHPGDKYISDDLQSAGIDKLLEVCRSFGPGVKSISGYLSAAIKRAFISESVEWNRNEFGNIPDGFDADDDVGEAIENNEVWLDNLFAACDETDREIVKRLAEGATQTAISDAMRIPRRLVGQRIAAIRKRVEAGKQAPDLNQRAA